MYGYLTGAKSNDVLKNISLKFKDRGALGAVLRLGFVEKDGKTTVSFVNPYYMFYAYWGKQMDGNEQTVNAMAESILKVFRTDGVLSAFGGTLDKEDLPKYHYKIMMPYFDDPDELEDFNSFEDGNTDSKLEMHFVVVVRLVFSEIVNFLCKKDKNFKVVLFEPMQGNRISVYCIRKNCQKIVPVSQQPAIGR